MARRTVVTVIDDLDGTQLREDGAVTVTFGVDGKQYEFDTSPAHAEQFYSTVAVYAEVSRRARRTLGARGPRSSEHNQAIRQWAQSHGYDLSDRGRIPVSVIEAFDAAHGHN